MSVADDDRDHTGVIAVLRDELAAVAGQAVTAADDEHLLRDGQVDSLDFLEFMARVELRFGVSIPDTEWHSLVTFELIADYVTERGRA